LLILLIQGIPLVSNEIAMSEQLVRIDGINQKLIIEEKRFEPDGLLEHVFIPLETVQIQQMVINDLIYLTDYWSVERWWRVFIHPITYDLMMSKFLQGRPVSVDYRIRNEPKVFIPKDKKVDGFSTVYKEHTDALKTMSGEELSYFMDSLGYDDTEGVFYAQRI
jgi:hypothetical protein